MLLAIDSATRMAGLALYDGTLIAECTWMAGRNHSTQLLSELEHLLGLVGVEREQLVAIGVSHGPGSFTGLRVGLALARGLSVGLGIPAYGLSSLEVLAAGHPHSTLPVWAVLEAGRARFAVAEYRSDGTRLVCAVPAANVSLDQLCDHISEPVLVTGDLTDHARQLLREHLPEASRIVSPSLAIRRPAVLAELAWRRHQRGDAKWPDSLVPVYVGQQATSRAPGA